jgi:uncharacterized protein YjbI with pentapeptide repeats
MKTLIRSLFRKVIAESNTLTLVQLVERNRHKLHNADLSQTNLRGADLREADLTGANLTKTDLTGANLTEAYLGGADLTGARLDGARLDGARLDGANLDGASLTGSTALYRANLNRTNLTKTDFRSANLSSARLHGANLTGANLTGANLTGANLEDANLTNTIGLTKSMRVKPGDIYWKRFNASLINLNYLFKVGLNKLRRGEVFASDERVLCSYPGFHFASREWCAEKYSDRPYEAKIRVPPGAKVNEPWATDGKASADKIEILQVFDTRTGKDVTNQFKHKKKRKKRKN